MIFFVRHSFGLELTSARTQNVSVRGRIWIRRSVPPNYGSRSYSFFRSFNIFLLTEAENFEKSLQQSLRIRPEMSFAAFESLFYSLMNLFEEFKFCNPTRYTFVRWRLSWLKKRKPLLLVIIVPRKQALQNYVKLLWVGEGCRL
jgi:hypothetical protein